MAIPTNEGYLMVPIKLDALFVPEEGLSVVGPYADYSRLPYAKKSKDSISTFNYDRPYTSETALTEPFIDQSHYLEPGMHLHWALPDALTNTSHKKKFKFPVCPNRWLVFRYKENEDPKKRELQKKWLVCSDYLWPEGKGPGDEPTGVQSPKVTFHHRSPDSPTQIPYRYQGWVQEFSPTVNIKIPEGDFLPIKYYRTDTPGPKKQFFSDDLTAIGNGDSHFAAFYPNCQGIYGMRDTDINKDTHLNDIRYEVYGWYEKLKKDYEDPNKDYEDPNKDILNIFINDHNKREDWLNAMEQELGWTIKETGSLPNKILCHTNITFNVEKAPPYPEELKNLDFNKERDTDNYKKTEIAIANTGTEALSVFLANKMDEDALKIENQLESLHLSPLLKDKNTDLTAYFEEARHTKTFKAISGGRLWALRQEGTQTSGQEQLRDPSRDVLAGRLFLQLGMKAQLDKVNKLQQKFNRSTTAIKEQKQHIFTAWHRYMRSTYHNPFENKKEFPLIDDVRMYIENLMDLLAEKEAYTGTISFNEKTGIWVADSRKIITKLVKSLGHLIPDIEKEFKNWIQVKTSEQAENTTVSLAHQIAEELNDIAGALKSYNEIIDLFRLLQADIKAGFLVSEMLEKEIVDNIRASVREIDSAIRKLNGEVMLPPKNIYSHILNQRELDTILKLLAPVIAPLAALPKIELLPIAGPRYWQPKEPVLLLAGPALKSTDRYGQDGVNSSEDGSDFLICQPTDIDLLPSTLLKYAADFSKKNNLSTYDNVISRNQAKNISNGSPWHPLFFEWEVRIDPLQQLSNIHPDRLKYHKDFITSNYELTDTKSEFIRQKNNQTISSISYFKGRSTLLPYAQELLLREIEDYIINASRSYIRSNKPPDPKEELLLRLTINDQLKAIDPNTDPSKFPEPNGEDKDEVADKYTSDLRLGIDAIVTEKQYRSEWLDYFEKNNLPIIAHNNPGEIKLPDLPFFNSTFKDIFKASSNSFFHTLLEIRDKIKDFQDDNLYIQTQALGGFNEALLSLKKTAQIEIAEPNGFTEYKAFSERVATEVNDNNLLTAEEDADFHPIRNGNLQLHRLKLVDTFGQVHPVVDQTVTLEQPEVYVPESMKFYNAGEAEKNNIVVIPPRITQPARLHFRWLSASDPELESNAHPDTSPICGWLIVNKLDLSIMIYDSQGYALGAIEDSGRWRLAPGKTRPQIPEAIANPALRKMVLWLVKQAPKKVETIQTTSFFELLDPEQEIPIRQTTFLEHFIDDLEKIMQDIAPDVTSTDNAKALLVGRPIALVQAAVDIHLKGWPAINQSLELFKEVVKGSAHYGDAFTEVEIPIRIGEQYRLNDGVVGYWLDSDQGYIEDKIRAPFNPKKHQLQTEIEKEEITFTQSIGAAPQRLAILMDPKGLIHCTTGILPTKSLSIPIHHYAAALERIQVTFQISPIISEPRNINLPLPQIAGCDWLWMERENNHWTALSAIPMIRKTDIEMAFENGSVIWKMLRDYGWLELQADNIQSAKLRNAKDRASAKLPLDDTQLETLEKVLEMLSVSIKDPSPQAHFQEPIKKGNEDKNNTEKKPMKTTSVIEIREGWLSLRPNK